MAEKRVSVRLAAVGGRQVQAELHGVGDAGKRGFGRLSREMEAANARLAAFARGVGIAAAAAVAAASAAGAAMVRSGLQTIQAQADVASSLNTTVASLQALHHAADLSGVAVSEAEAGVIRLTRRLSLFVKDGGGPAAKAIERLKLNAHELLQLPINERLRIVNEALDRYASRSERAALLSQLFGDRAWTAFARLSATNLSKATRDVRDFGVAVSEVDAARIGRVNEALARIGLIWRGLTNQLTVSVAPALEAVAEAMAALARTIMGPLGQGIRALFDNMGRLFAYAAPFAAFLAGRWVAALLAAALSVRGLATALALLRGALIRTGIGALIVGAGELIYQFARLVRGAGGFGEALRLVGNVAREVWERIGTGGEVLALSLRAVFARIGAGWFTTLAVLQKRWADFLHQVAASARQVPGLDATALALGNSAIRAGSAYHELAAAAEAATAKANDFAQAARDTAGTLTAPLASMAELRAALRQASEDAETGAGGAERLADALEATGRAAKTAKTKLTGWAATVAAVKEYADKARDIGQGLGDALVGAFTRAEDAIGEFVKTGKLKFTDLVTSLIADLAKIAARRFLLGPLASALSGALGGAGGLFASVLHAGGVVGAPGPGRMVPALAFAGAPRLHAGGWAGLKPDEVPAILQRGERVLSRREAAAFGRDTSQPAVTITIVARDADSFRQSRTQVAADIARAVALGRRGL